MSNWVEKQAARCLLSLLASIHIASATTVIVFRDGNTIVLGTESFRHDPGGNSVQCKLEHINGVFFAMHGAAVAVNALGFDARAIARGEMGKSGSIESRYNLYRDRILAGLRPYVDGERTHHSERYAIYSHQLDFPVGTVFAAMEKGKAVLIVTRFIVDPNGNVIVAPFPISSDKVIYRGGFAEKLDLLLIKRWLGEVSPAIAAQRVINATISQYPESNAAPVAIVRINSMGYDWIDRPQNCSE